MTELLVSRFDTQNVTPELVEEMTATVRGKFDKPDEAIASALRRNQILCMAEDGSSKVFIFLAEDEVCSSGVSEKCVYMGLMCSTGGTRYGFSFAAKEVRALGRKIGANWAWARTQSPLLVPQLSKHFAKVKPGQVDEADWRLQAISKTRDLRTAKHSPWLEPAAANYRYTNTNWLQQIERAKAINSLSSFEGHQLQYQRGDRLILLVDW